MSENTNIEKEIWLPIDTAPKDGREIIAYGIFHGTYGYTEPEETWTGIAWSVNRWRVTKPTGRYFSGFTPFYWMLIPDKPKITIDCLFIK